VAPFGEYYAVGQPSLIQAPIAQKTNFEPNH